MGDPTLGTESILIKLEEVLAGLGVGEIEATSFVLRPVGGFIRAPSVGADPTEGDRDFRLVLLCLVLITTGVLPGAEDGPRGLGEECLELLPRLSGPCDDVTELALDAIALGITASSEELESADLVPAPTVIGAATAAFSSLLKLNPIVSILSFMVEGEEVTVGSA